MLDVGVARGVTFGHSRGMATKKRKPAKRRAAPKVQFILVADGPRGNDVTLRGRSERYALKAADQYGAVVRGWERRGRGEWRHVLDVFPKGQGSRTAHTEVRVFWL